MNKMYTQNHFSEVSLMRKGFFVCFLFFFFFLYHTVLILKPDQNTMKLASKRDLFSKASVVYILGSKQNQPKFLFILLHNKRQYSR